MAEARLPELVRDSKLQTVFEGTDTVHFYVDRPGRHAKRRRETWRQERILGSGGYGVVWLERKKPNNEEEQEHQTYRAVKQIHSGKSQAMVDLCKAELEALAKFSRGEYARCFVRSYGWYEGPGFLSISMEYCPFGDLKSFLTERGRFPEADTQDIISQIVEGLYFMHREGFAHRDLKPGVCSPPDRYTCVVLN
jgi:serine/threonine protein kinase